MTQLVLPLTYQTHYRLEDFYISAANKGAFNTIMRDWFTRKMILTGDAGSGKTHLTTIWAQQKNATIIPAQHLSESWLGKLTNKYVAIEDIDPNFTPEFEKMLFHLHNMTAHSQGALLITSRARPSSWRISLPDLQSRITASDIVTLPPPDDALLRAVLVKSFSERQIILSPNILEYILKRMERSLLMAGMIVEYLDMNALEKGQAITLKSVRNFFENNE